MTEEEKKVLEKLLIDEKTIIQRLADMAQGIIGIDKNSGELIILAPKSKLTDREQIFLALLGRYFSHKLGLAETDSMTTDGIAQKLGMDSKAASARLSDLKRERAVDGLSRGEYRISYANIETTLSGIKEKLRR